MARTVNILLSTYNGMGFLSQQIDSLLAQSYPNIKITARDDGSTDGTYEKLLEYERQYPNFIILRDERKRMGVWRSYFKLLQEADPDCDFYAFCDQDDVWLPDKVRDAITAMQSQDLSKPVMYFSRLEYVDSRLSHLGYSQVFKQVGFTNALIENAATGCTIVLNSAARKLICEQTPRDILIHDWWCYLVISAFGKLIYDDKINIKYRLHEGNTVGHPINWWKRVQRRFTNKKERKPAFRASDQVKEFYRCYGERLKPSDLRIVVDFLEAKRSFLPRIKYAIRMEVWKQARWATFLLHFRILTGRF